MSLFQKVRASSYCQASRLVYSAFCAATIWRETRADDLGLWYAAGAWLAAVGFLDIGFTATAVERVAALRGNRERSHILAAATVSGAFLALIFVAIAAVFAGFAALRISGTHIGIVLAILITAVNGWFTGLITLQLSIVQAAGHWEESMYLPIAGYGISSGLLAIGMLAKAPSIELLSICQLIYTLIVHIRVDRRVSEYIDESLSLRKILKTKIQVRDVFGTLNIRYYSSMLATAAVARTGLLAATLKLKGAQMGELGKLSQTITTAVSVCFFPVNGLANRAIGDLRSGKSKKDILLEVVRLLVLTVGVAACGCTALLVCLSLHVKFLVPVSMGAFHQGLLATAIILDSVVVGVVPIATYFRSGRYLRESMVVAAMAVLPWSAFVFIGKSDFVVWKIWISASIAIVALSDLMALGRKK